ncbi:MAG: magnesium/cobalt transporter CorA [Planctomycetota bacterium]|jgi:magnesium transporter
MDILKSNKGFAEKAKLPPGTPVFAGTDKNPTTVTRIIDFDSSNFTEHKCKDVGECLPFKDTDTVTWIDVAGLENIDFIHKLCERLDIHPLVQEDILNINQRPRCENHDNYIYLVIKDLSWNSEQSSLRAEQISIILLKNMVITFREKQNSLFKELEERIKNAKGRIRKMQTDYLSFCILDTIIDDYFGVLEDISVILEPLEDEAMMNPSRETQEKVFNLRQQGLLLRRFTWPVRELLATFQRQDSDLLNDEVLPYLRDIYDHAIHIIDSVEIFREVIRGVLDTYLASLSHRMNEVMKVLTIIATIFIPITFIAGIYGMNFEFMPELKVKWAYPAVWGVMLSVTGIMLFYFRKKKWL